MADWPELEPKNVADLSPRLLRWFNALSILSGRLPPYKHE